MSRSRYATKTNTANLASSLTDRGLVNKVNIVYKRDVVAVCLNLIRHNRLSRANYASD